MLTCVWWEEGAPGRVSPLRLCVRRHSCATSVTPCTRVTSRGTSGCGSVCRAAGDRYGPRHRLVGKLFSQRESKRFGTVLSFCTSANSFCVPPLSTVTFSTCSPGKGLPLVVTIVFLGTDRMFLRLPWEGERECGPRVPDTTDEEVPTPDEGGAARVGVPSTRGRDSPFRRPTSVSPVVDPSEYSPVPFSVVPETRLSSTVRPDQSHPSTRTLEARQGRGVDWLETRWGVPQSKLGPDDLTGCVFRPQVSLPRVRSLSHPRSLWTGVPNLTCRWVSPVPWKMMGCSGGCGRGLPTSRVDASYALLGRLRALGGTSGCLSV